MTSHSNADTDATTELYVQLAQSARQAMPAAWAWCRVAAKKQVLIELSQIVLDYAGIEDLELSDACISLFAKTTNGFLYHDPLNTSMSCKMPLVGGILIYYDIEYDGSTDYSKPFLPGPSLTHARLALSMHKAACPFVFACQYSVLWTDALTIEWSCEQHPESTTARVAFQFQEDDGHVFRTKAIVAQRLSSG